MNAIPALPLRRALGAAALFAAAALAGAGEAAAPVSWAEPPHWPVGLAPLDPGAGTGKKAPKARILAWLPEGVEHPRCVLLLTNNSDCKDFGQHPALRAVAQRRAMAIVYIRSYPAGGSGKTGFGPPAEGPDGRQQSLDAVAEATGKPSLRHAPWIVLGKSSVAHFALEAAWRQPQRTIASIIYHGEVPSWPLPEGVAATRETVLHCNL
ncbi:MAG: hypothetical protein RL456_3386, partial [Pseudomonadota bacterium]